MNTVRLYRWPVTEYGAALRWQQATADALHCGGEEALALLQHPPVYTFGRLVRREHLLADEAMLLARGADVIESDRGGDITFHGPGQLVCYPILDLRRHAVGAVDYVRKLEEVIIRSLAQFGIDASRWHGRPGVWVEGAKIASIGVRVSGGMTTHGFALNVNPDLAWFDAIVPCGLADASMTSMAQVMETAPNLRAAGDAVVASFGSVFEIRLTEVAAGVKV